MHSASLHSMKIFVCGTRGIPGIPGGVETHCEALFPLIRQSGIEVTVCRRSAYVHPAQQQMSEYRGVRLVDLPSPRKKSLEAILHTLSAVWYARWHGFKIVHIHAIGPALAVPFARLLGLKTVVTHHGPDYDRQKWGRAAKLALKLGEWCAVHFSNEMIAISQTISDLLKTKYGYAAAHRIPNGVHIPVPATATDYLATLGLEKGRYAIAVGRFVPEKGFHDLLDAWEKSRPDCKLVLVGDADHESDYSLGLKNRADSLGVVRTGYINGEKLRQIYSHAALFVMPSYHEGLPIALLEAMSYNLKTVVSVIPANLEVGLSPECYFETGNTADLSARIAQQLTSTTPCDYAEILLMRYNWETIAAQTIALYRRLGGIKS